jgi:hypothetical protein
MISPKLRNAVRTAIKYSDHRRQLNKIEKKISGMNTTLNILRFSLIINSIILIRIG